MEWLFRDVSVRVEMGPYNDKHLGVAVKARNIPLGLELGGVPVTANEATEAENVEYWPSVSLSNTDRRRVIFHAASEALQKTELLSQTSIGFFTLGLEVARIPTWEIAEEIVRALHTHCQNDCGIDKVVIVASTPTQISSLQYALDNVHIIV